VQSPGLFHIELVRTASLEAARRHDRPRPEPRRRSSWPRRPRPRTWLQRPARRLCSAPCRSPTPTTTRCSPAD